MRGKSHSLFWLGCVLLFVGCIDAQQDKTLPATKADLPVTEVEEPSTDAAENAWDDPATFALFIAEQLKSDRSIQDLARMLGPTIVGWMNYYCRFYASAFSRVAAHVNRALVRWAVRKFKRLRGHRCRAIDWVTRLARQRPDLFPHWRAGYVSVAR